MIFRLNLLDINILRLFYCRTVCVIAVKLVKFYFEFDFKGMFGGTGGTHRWEEYPRAIKHRHMTDNTRVYCISKGFELKGKNSSTTLIEKFNQLQKNVLFRFYTML